MHVLVGQFIILSCAMLFFIFFSKYFFNIYMYILKLFLIAASYDTSSMLLWMIVLATLKNEVERVFYFTTVALRISIYMYNAMLWVEMET